MIKCRIFLLFTFVLAPYFGLRAQNILVDDTRNAQYLVENILINSPCASAANFSSSGDTFSAGQQSFGYFDGSGTSFPFQNGIVMSTSRAKRAEGPNDNLIDEGNPNWHGDNDLEQALGITNTFNATSIEFDFTPLTSQVSFDYIFASEEYQGTAPCTYSDGFAFLLKRAGSGDPYQNLAVLPGTTTPVLVTSVHPAITGSCSAQNESYFGGYNGTSAPVNYNGQTTPLTAKAQVIPGVTYHIKLVIADHENIRYDSAIFLAGGSFRVGTDIGPNRLISANNPVCAGSNYVLDATEAAAVSYKWFKNSVQITGAVAPTYTVTSAGTYRAEVSLGTSGCIASGEAVIEYSNGPNLIGTTLAQCDAEDDGQSLFNLHNADNIIINGDAEVQQIRYYDSMANAVADTNAIANPDNYLSGNTTIYARGSNSYGCSTVVPVQLAVIQHYIENFPLLETCDYDPDPVQDGFYHFTLSDADSQVLNGLPSGLVVQYYETINDVLLHPENVLPAVPYTNTQQNNQTVYAKIINGPDCYGIIPVNLVVNTLAPPDFEEELYTVCEGHPTTLMIPAVYVSYAWSNGDTDNETTITEPGNYSVTVSENGCTATKYFTVISPPAPVITSVDIKDMNGADNSLLIHYTGTGNYEFSVDGTHYQDSPAFNGLPAGDYIVEIRDKNYCGSDTEFVTLVDYPKYFTPNGDGFNDYWAIDMYLKQPDAVLCIFDRYGKLVAQFRGNERGWDGKFKSKNLPATDYWFTVTAENGKTIKGHFSLIR